MLCQIFDGRMPCVCIKEGRKPTKHRIEDIELSSSVSFLKNKAAEKLKIPVEEQKIIYAGLVLQDESTLEANGVKDGCTVYLLRNSSHPEPIEQDPEVMSVQELIPILETAIMNPEYRNTVVKMLNNPEMLEQLAVATPGLADDPVAMSLLREPELLQQVVETADIESVVSRHPSLVQAASYIAAAVEKESLSPATVRVHRRNRQSNPADEGSDEDMANLEPGIIAQAELMAANEERIQQQQLSRRTSQTSHGITSSQLASALASAGLQTARQSPTTNSGAGPSTSGASTSGSSAPSLQSRGVTRELLSTSLASALNVTQPQSSSQMQPQLQQLRAMGITDDALSLQALAATNGDIQAALELIFSQGTQ